MSFSPFVLITILVSSGLSAKAAGPFAHGVASGDPLPNGLIIWTRVTPQNPRPAVVRWQVATDEKMVSVIRSGQVQTDSATDYTVKVDVSGLAPATAYYYGFAVYGQASVTGRTRTAPAVGVKALRFAVVSCSNYAEGHFSAFARIADRPNLDAVIHLGDYIYEGTGRAFERRPAAPVPLADPPGRRSRDWWLRYYRKRYALAHTDENLQKAHRQHPFIAVWDDHETADNAYKDGADGHDPARDGAWADRKAAARQAYAEWLPIRGNATTIYRSLAFGNLMELVMLDTRLEGRDKQIYQPGSPKLTDPARTLLGVAQKKWVLDRLRASPARWKLLGSQVIFSDFNVGWAANAGPFAREVQQLQGNLLDYWQGYPAERAQVLRHLATHRINNVVVLSASMHCALAFDVIPAGIPYDPTTGQGAVAVEFATPSIASANFDERIGTGLSAAFEASINRPLPAPFNINPNPHLKFADLDRHGYLLLTLTPAQTLAEWYFMDDVQDPFSKETPGEAWRVKAGENRLGRK